MEKITRSLKETHQLAKTFIEGELHTNIFGLMGELGSGKTSFIQGIGKALNIDAHLTSPTFLILKTYPVPQHPIFQRLVHLDLYRINAWAEIEGLGIDELWQNPANLVLIEWADRIKDALPNHTQLINFEHVSESLRKIII